MHREQPDKPKSKQRDAKAHAKAVTRQERACTGFISKNIPAFISSFIFVLHRACLALTSGYSGYSNDTPADRCMSQVPKAVSAPKGTQKKRPARAVRRPADQGVAKVPQEAEPEIVQRKADAAWKLLVVCSC